LTRFEKIFFSSIILIKFGVILFLNIQLNHCKHGNYTSQFPVSAGNKFVLSTFIGETANGKEEWIQFTAYSPKLYLFATISRNCQSCEIFLGKWNRFFKNNRTEMNIHPILLTDESIKNFNTAFVTEVLKISRDDMVQFGFDMPSIFAVNGKGEILFMQPGYSEGVSEVALKEILKNKNKKSREIGT